MGAGVGVVRWGKLSSLPTSQDRENPNTKHGLLTTFNLHTAPSRHWRTSNTHTPRGSADIMENHPTQQNNPTKACMLHYTAGSVLSILHILTHCWQEPSLVDSIINVYTEMTEHRKIRVPRVKQQVHSKARCQTWQSGPRVHAFNLHRARLFIKNKWQ